MQCYEWVPYIAGDFISERMIFTDTQMHMICRMKVGDNDVVCYFTRALLRCYGAMATTGPYFNSHQGYPCQRLRIMEGCTIFWVPYTARDPIPHRAVTAGSMANGDRVYVTKFGYNNSLILTLAGHYVEGADATVSPLGWATRRSSTMMMMVILWTFPIIHPHG